MAEELTRDDEVCQHIQDLKNNPLPTDSGFGHIYLTRGNADHAVLRFIRTFGSKEFVEKQEYDFMVEDPLLWDRLPKGCPENCSCRN